jgi:hypothetical protein
MPGGGPLRQAIERMANDNFNPQGGPGWWERVKARWIEYFGLLAKIRKEKAAYYRAGFINFYIQGVVYALFGGQVIVDALSAALNPAGDGDLSSHVADLLRGVFEHPEIKELTETLGTIITEPILTIFESYAGKDNVDPKEFARAFHGFMISLNLASGMGSTLVEAATAGAVKGAGKMIDQMYWSLGLGFLGWQTLAPLLSSGLQPGLERYYQRLYRPQRFSAGDLRDLYALGKITMAQLKDEAKTLGWRDADIDQWIQLAFRTLTQGDIWQAYHEGLLTESEATTRLRVLGYDPADIPLLFKLNPPDETKNSKSFTVSTAKKAFEENLISEKELRSILADLKYQAREIDLIVALENLAKQTTARSLTQSQIKSAYEENVITRPEADHWLTQAGFGTTETKLILDTWDAQLVPVYRKLNIGTITGAYVAGVLTRGTAKTKLQSVGLTGEDAELELKLVEARNPEAFGLPAPQTERKLTAGALSQLVSLGIITLAQMETKLEEIGYTPEDAALLVEAARRANEVVKRPLPQSSIERAYLAGVLTRAQALAALKVLSYSDASAATILDTVERENPETFGAPPEVRVKQLSAGTIEDLFFGGFLTALQMTARLVEIGYTQTDAALLTSRAQQLATPVPAELTPNLIERAYVAGIFDRPQALARLESLDFTPQDASDILDTVERENPQVFDPASVQAVALPSITTLARAVQEGLLTEAEYYTRAQETGWSKPDAAIYLTFAATAERKSVVGLSASNIVNAYGEGIFAWQEALSRLTQKGYSDSDAQVLLRLERDNIFASDPWINFTLGRISINVALADLIEQHYTDEQIYNAFASLEPGEIEDAGLTLDAIAGLLNYFPGG